MNSLYSEKDLQQISGQLKKRYLLLGCGLAVILALMIVSLVIRLQWLTVITFFLLFAAAVFVIELFCLPLHRYKKLLVSALTARTHIETMEYKCTESEISIMDGVPCRGIIFLGEPDKHGTREQRFYWDEELPLPAFSEGDRVTLKYTGRTIVAYQC